ncbi:trihelix transcription factor GTL1-like isoform X1 [Zingiber officinale]|uniref:trihelix transcription factor GTL1-like isoform X1 n=1 Tax=Zingiber officinale TaxID=94328 RepID=UPI001C4D3BAC|nr:trihelix transcription factor GTL1-like isoform X1 [Zingiber officinale]
MQQQQQQGATQFGASPSGILPFSSAPLASRAHLLGIQPSDVQEPASLAEVASPISSRPPPAAAAGNFDKLQVAGDFPDDEALAAAQGDDTERGGGATGNRWPRQETLALLKIRSEMDASFRDATLKGPLWEEVSRKLAELGYKRSAKKCKEKFENVHKYYKRTKEGRAGRQDGKSYRFFTQLEALHSGSHLAGGIPPVAPSPAAFADVSSGFSTAAAMVGQPPANRAQPISSVAPPPPIIALPTRVVAPELQTQGISTSAEPTVGFSFSSNSSSSASSDSDEETAGESQEGRKRKRETATTSRKMMAFFDGLMKQVMERQEAMQKRFLEAVEKKEQDRMIREEAWRRQEMTRFNREQELLAQERAMAASRDTVIISYLQKITGQNISLPTPIFPPAPAITSAAMPASQSSILPSQITPPPPQTVLQPPPSAAEHTQPPQIQQSAHRHNQLAGDITRHPSPLGTLELAPSSEPPNLDVTSPSSSSRWPKAEVHTLIKIRSGLDSKYQDSGPKGPLWEEISLEMQRLGYNRSAKRCKEKWENINKYYKKVKESNKRRPEDSKTCPYFHQLDALYRSKHLGAGGGPMQRPQLGSDSTNIIPSSNQQQSDATTMNRPQEQASAMPPPPPPPLQLTAETERKNGNSETNAGVQVQTGNGGLTAGFFEQGLKKPEDIMKELMGQRLHQAATDHDYDKLDDDSDNMDQDEEDEDEDNEDDEINNDKVLHYKI